MARSKESIPDEIKAMGFSEPKSEVKLIKYKTKPVGQFDVDIRVNYNGMTKTLFFHEFDIVATTTLLLYS
jgi:hypothetical protein